MGFSELHLIQQQMYTRERRGVFRTTEGFDTVAKSAGLEAAWIKKVLHPLCTYDAPSALTARGVKEENAYPDALHLIRTESGDMILGRSVFKAADFTGLRSAFFTHNLVIPAGAPEGASDYKLWLNATFAGSYDIEQGTELPELDKLPAQGLIPKESSREILTRLGLDEAIFTKLLYAVMMSVAGRKKVYIALNTEAEDTSKAAKSLLHILYSVLPFAFRRKLGFITYVKEPSSRKGIHVTFTEPGGLRQGDRSIDKDYIFDLAQSRVLNAEPEDQQRVYLSWIWQQLQQDESPEEYFKFAAQMLEGMEPERELSLNAYDELALLYRMENGDPSGYENNRERLLRALIQYLSIDNALPQKMRLNDLFLEAFDREFDRVKNQYIPEPSFIEAFREYYKIDKRYIEFKLVEYLIRSLNNAFATGRQAEAARIVAAVEQAPDLKNSLLTKLLSNQLLTSTLFVPYLQGQLRTARNMQELMSMLMQWVRYRPGLEADEQIQETMIAAVAQTMGKEEDLVAAANVLHDRLEQAERDASHAALFLPGMADALGEAADMVLITKLKLLEMKPSQITQLRFCNRSDLGPWVARLNRSLQQKAVQLIAAYDWFANVDPGLTLLEGLSADDEKAVQDWALEWLPEEIRQGNFALILPAFYASTGEQAGMVNYVGMLQAVRNWAASPETICAFIRWSEERIEFGTARGGYEIRYRHALLAYFRAEGREVLHQKQLWNKYFKPAPEPYQSFYVQAKRQTEAGWLRVFRRMGKGGRVTIMIALLGVVVCGSLLAAGVWGQDQAKQPTPQSPSVQQPVPSGQGVGSDEPTAVTVVLQAAKSQAGEWLLELQFPDEASRLVFAPEHISVIEPDGTSHEFEQFKVLPVDELSTLSTENPSSDSSSSADSTGATGTNDSSNSAGSGNVNDSDESDDSTPSRESASGPAGSENKTTVDGTGDSSNTVTPDSASAPAADETQEPSVTYPLTIAIQEDYSFKDNSKLVVDEVTMPLIIEKKQTN